MKFFEKLKKDKIKSRPINNIGDLTPEEYKKIREEVLLAKAWRSTSRPDIVFSSEEIAKILFENDIYTDEKWREALTSGSAIKLNNYLMNIIENYESSIKELKIQFGQLLTQPDNIELDYLKEESIQLYKDNEILKEENEPKENEQKKQEEKNNEN